MKDAQREILWRVYLLYGAVLSFAIAVVVKIALIQYNIGNELLEESEKLELKVFNLEAMRGNILSDDGSLLATSVPVFELRMDVSSPHIDDALLLPKLILWQHLWPDCFLEKLHGSTPVTFAMVVQKATGISCLEIKLLMHSSKRSGNFRYSTEESTVAD